LQFFGFLVGEKIMTETIGRIIYCGINVGKNIRVIGHLEAKFKIIKFLDLFELRIKKSSFPILWQLPKK